MPQATVEIGGPDRPLTIALPKGRLLDVSVELLARGGIDASAALQNGRRLMAAAEGGGIRFLLTRSSDVPTYVEYGAADLGIAGKDVLLEAAPEPGGFPGVMELADLRIGRCRMIVAVPGGGPVRRVRDLQPNSRVATKYPRTATRFFNDLGLAVEVVRLHGSIELAPLVGLADAIVDVTETGRTLEENGLVAIATVAELSARLIANPVSYRVRFEPIERLMQVLALEGIR